MGHDELACASCGGPVSEGRCGTCRAAREMLRSQNPGLTWQVLGQLLIAIAVLLGALVIAVEYSG